MSTQIALLVTKMVADTGDFDRKMKTTSGKISAVGRVGAYMGLGIAAGVGYAVKSAADFQQSMNVLHAVTGATSGQMAKMRKEAIGLGNDTKLPTVSAQDAATAMTELAKGGLSVRDSMKAARGTLELATAAQISGADAASIQAKALNAFGLSGSKAGHVADILAGAANKSTADITDLAQGMQQASAVFHASGQNIGSLTTALGLMANKGIQGSDAGTSLKTMMQRLNPQTKKAREEMQKLGVHVFTANGHYRNLRNIIGQFSGALGKLTPKQKQHALYTIFGSDASRAANFVLAGGVKQYDKMHAAVTKTGNAQKAANAYNKGAKGAMAQLSSAVQTLGIDFGTVLLPTVKDVAQELTKATGWLDKHKTATKILVGALAVLAAGMIAVNVAYKAYLFWGKLVTLQQALMNSVFIANPIGLLVVALVGLVAIGILLYKKWKPFRELVNYVWDELKKFGNWVKGVFSKTIPNAFHSIVQWLKGHWQDILIGIVGGPFVLLVKKANDAFGLVGKIKSAFNTVMSTIKGWGSDFITWITNLPGKLYDKAKTLGSRIKDGIVDGFKDIVGGLGRLEVNGINAIIAAWNKFQIPGFHKTISIPLGPDVTIGWGAIDLPDIPYISLARGGIVTGPTLAMVGDNPSRREAIVPLPSQGLGAPTYNITIAPQGTILAERDLQRTIIETLSDYGVRNGRVRLSKATTS